MFPPGQGIAPCPIFLPLATAILYRPLFPSDESEAVALPRPSREQVDAIRRSLPAWFRLARRDLPWRRTRDPYAIWVSEIMLQQTRVTAVKPYYLRFLRRFPTVESLARGRIDTVLKLWEGMGYYTRARNLHQAARRVVAEFSGRLPKSAEALRALPGIGPYTAGAIASIAFGLDEPVLDGNVIRVLCRVFRVRSSPARPDTRRELWSLARRLIPPGQAGDFNQAMMELGATVCLPRRPHCDVCPLRAPCQALRHGEQALLPLRHAKPPLPHHNVVAGVIRKAGRILIDRRRPEGLLGGLWEFPGGKVQPGESLPAALRREAREELGIEIDVGPKIADVRHAYSHFRITMSVFECRWRRGTPQAIGCSDVRWVRPGELTRYAFPKANHKVVEQLTSAATPGRA